jgi:hypothetical protein
MSRRPIGETAMSDAERQQRRRDKAKAARDAAPPPDVDAVQTNGSEPEAIAAPTAGTPGHADYPRMLYHPDGRTMVVDTPEAHDRVKPYGWGTIPLAVHRQRPVTHHGFLGTDNPFVWPMRRW